MQYWNAALSLIGPRQPPALNLRYIRDLDSAVPKADTWDRILRKQIKLEHGWGRSLSPQSGTAKLTRRLPDGTRSSDRLPSRGQPQPGMMTPISSLRMGCSDLACIAMQT